MWLPRRRAQKGTSIFPLRVSTRCVPVPPERNLRGDWLERGTGVRGAHLQGAHLRLPGHGGAGPTLEIFRYNVVLSGPPPHANRAGFAHIAFAVDDVAKAREAVLTAGGSAVGTVESVVIPGAGKITWTYLRDPEGNIIELQRRDPEPALR
ncbi:MAG: VOC family protein [Acidobacteria bacterium]|nr:VOC family protein [Acidobacteriota bacterium]